MNRSPLRRSLPTLIVAALLLGVGWLSVASSAEAQSECLSQDECRALRQEIRELRRELRPIRREIRSLRHEIRQLPPGDPQRAVLREKVRELRQEGKPIRQELRPLKKRHRAECRNCQ